jgi:hypothetical protein
MRLVTVAGIGVHVLQRVGNLAVELRRAGAQRIQEAGAAHVGHHAAPEIHLQRQSLGLDGQERAVEALERCRR